MVGPVSVREATKRGFPRDTPMGEKPWNHDGKTRELALFIVDTTVPKVFCTFRSPAMSDVVDASFTG